MSLDISPLLNAIARLQEGWQRYQLDISDIQIRDGLVKRFEFIYEISHKMLKRYLEHSSASPEKFDQMPFADLICSVFCQNTQFGLLVHGLMVTLSLILI